MASMFPITSDDLFSINSLSSKDKATSFALSPVFTNLGTLDATMIIIVKPMTINPTKVSNKILTVFILFIFF